MHRIAAVVAGLSLAFVGTSATIAGTIHVPGDHALIQDAIDACPVTCIHWSADPNEFEQLNDSAGKPTHD